LEDFPRGKKSVLCLLDPPDSKMAATSDCRSLDFSPFGQHYRSNLLRLKAR
jgi:hypothetical protein